MTNYKLDGVNLILPEGGHDFLCALEFVAVDHQLLKKGVCVVILDTRWWRGVDGHAIGVAPQTAVIL